MREIIVDNFAGGGGASYGIYEAIERNVDIAINHDPAAIAMHKVNHPQTKHYCESVWDVDPVEVCAGRPVALAWFSPDCKHFSKAKGGKPVEKSIRGLAWVAVRWAKLVRPRVIMLENVEEFKTWGPLLDGKPDPKKKGKTFKRFIHALKRYGYQVEWKELRACDYGAPTIRKRFFIIARCDNNPIVWPNPEYGDPESLIVKCGLSKPYKTAAECIDWSIPCPSIFGRKKPLVENTLKRIANGLKKFVFCNHNPFIIKNEHLTVANLIQYHGEQSKKEVRGQNLEKPLMVVDSSNRYGLVTAFLSKYFSDGSELKLSIPKAKIVNDSLVTSNIVQMNKNCDGRDLNKPFNTIVAGSCKFLEVRSFLTKYYGTGEDGQSVDSPLHTITSRDRFGLVTVKGEDYQIIDIGMRMLTPRELFRAQGFPDTYVIDHDDKGNPYPKTAQVARCGNAVPPAFSKALVRANLPELCGEYAERKVV